MGRKSNNMADDDVPLLKVSDSHGAQSATIESVITRMLLSVPSLIGREKQLASHGLQPACGA
jgi:hypothetical protein